MKYSRKIKNKRNAGYALYTAIILTSVLILIAYITADISSKELVLSSSSADSHLAFYNADSGVECALYWDVKNPSATPPGSSSGFDATTPDANITCNNTSEPVTPGTDSSGDPTRTFTINFTTGCAVVTVTKNADLSTTINSLGYNSCSGSNRLERGITTTY